MNSGSANGSTATAITVPSVVLRTYVRNASTMASQFAPGGQRLSISADAYEADIEAARPPEMMPTFKLGKPG